jgi:uncharacterized protein YjbI with pentapeptide repeats
MSDLAQCERKAANENFWYCLATLYGEQPHDLDHHDRNHELATRNRLAWNRWIAGVLSVELRAELAVKGFPAQELNPLSDGEKKDFCEAFAIRVGLDTAVPPDPAMTADFAMVSFERITDFGGFLFYQGPNFELSAFGQYADFGAAIFCDKAWFHRTTFFKNVNFSNSAFLRDAIFGMAKFCQNASFDSAAFQGEAYFVSAEIFRISFLAAAFVKNVQFRDVSSNPGSVDFSASVFSDDADFSDAKLFEIRCESATFTRNARFKSAKLTGDADFSSATFLQTADFEMVTFSNFALFINAEFKGRTIFVSVDFQSRVPDFRGAKMHEATEWHGTKWPYTPLGKVDAQAQVYAYERLKLEMERLKKHEDEQLFFRKELRARRGLVSKWSVTWILNYLYGNVSDYGHSIGRPLLGLVILFGSGVAIFATIPVLNKAALPLRTAVGLSFGNIFSFLPIKRDILPAEMILSLSSVAQATGAAESLIGAALLFLLGLAVRNRFRLK